MATIRIIRKTANSTFTPVPATALVVAKTVSAVARSGFEPSAGVGTPKKVTSLPQNPSAGACSCTSEDRMVSLAE